MSFLPGAVTKGRPFTPNRVPTMTVTSAAEQKTRECLDVTPTRNGKRFALKWVPATTDYSPQAGFVTLEDAKTSATYTVTEAPADAGRAFVFSKLSGGTDPGREWYCLTIGTERAACNCKGHTRWGWCKHSDALEALVANGWV